MQTELLVDTLLELPGLRLAVRAEQVGWRRKTMIRGPRTLPCTW
jgi:biflaviolin synthase